MAEWYDLTQYSNFERLPAFRFGSHKRYAEICLVAGTAYAAVGFFSDMANETYYRWRETQLESTDYCSDVIIWIDDLSHDLRLLDKLIVTYA